MRIAVPGGCPRLTRPPSIWPNLKSYSDDEAPLVTLGGEMVSRLKGMPRGCHPSKYSLTERKVPRGDKAEFHRGRQKNELARLAGFEPATLGLEVLNPELPNLLSYG